MEVTKLQEDFLLDMLEYYCENPEERRNQNVYGNCMYAPQKDTSEGCAIGRKISKELQQKFDSRRESPVVNNVFNLLPENLQLLGCDFLTEVQQLHDGGYFWEEKDAPHVELL